MDRPKILVIGSANQDLVIRTARPPHPGETVMGEDLKFLAGGKGANQAVAAARLGAGVAFCGRVGADVFGSRLRGDLEAEGLDVALLADDPSAPTGTATILVFPSGENMIVVSPGANGRVGPDDLAPLRGRMERFHFLLLQQEIPLETVRAAAEMAHGAGVRVILDPSPAYPLPSELLRHIDIIAPNEAEAEIVAGRRAGAEDAALEAARDLVRMGAREAIIKRGARGAVWVSGEEELSLEAFPVNAVDATAAGDAFIAAAAVSLARGGSRRDALRLACAAGALAATRLGAQASLPTTKELEEFLGREGLPAR